MKLPFTSVVVFVFPSPQFIRSLLIHPYISILHSVITFLTQAIENQLLWNIRKVTFPILLSILLFHARHQSTNLEKKASGLSFQHLYIQEYCSLQS